MNRVNAIRSDALVGSGSCTSIDECFTDQEVIELLDEDSILTPHDAVSWARDCELLWLENALNYRWGEDTDSQLITYRSFKDKLSNTPISI
jgi:hypothetical protein